MGEAETNFNTTLKQLYRDSSLDSEVTALESARQELLPEAKDLVTEEDDEPFEEDWLDSTTRSIEDGNPFPGKKLCSILENEEELNDFVFYVFDRRFGWSESESLKEKRQRVTGGFGASKQETHYKAAINDYLDEFRKWFMSQNISLCLLEALENTVAKSHSKPVVRNQTFIYLFDWLKKNAETLNETHIDLVMKLLLQGLTDVWSAIRNACVSRLPHVIEHFNIKQLETFFNQLVKICQEEESTWQAVEGSAMGMNAVLKKFQWISVIADNCTDQASSQVSPRTQYFLKFGTEELRAMPKFISFQIQDVIFPLLAHPQLSVREHATKTLSSYLTRCEFQEAVAAFQSILDRMSAGTGIDWDSDYTSQPLPHLSVLRADFQFLHAYEAEGLLGACVFLIKQIPPSFLLHKWPVYISTFTLYLMHPASAVRITASDIFKFLVAKESSNPVFLKLVLQSLTSDWHPKLEFLSASQNQNLVKPANQSSSNPPAQSKERRASVKVKGQGRRTTVTKLASQSAENIPEAWEYREGKMLAYELILKFLIKNHWLYTFGTPSFGQQENENTSITDSRGKSSSYGGNSLHGALQHAKSTTDADHDNAMPFRDFSRSGRLSQIAEEMRPRTNSLSSGSQAKDIPGNSLVRRTITQVSTSAGAMEALSTRHGRMSTVTGHTSVKPIGRHFSYYNHSPGRGFTSHTTSLLLCTSQWDQQTQNEDKHKREAEILHQSANSKKAKGSHEVQLPWVESLKLLPLADLLKTIYLQSLESMADVRWELRRMGQQLLPCVVEVMRWSHMGVLEKLWAEDLRPESSLLCYGACIALKDSLAHAARLRHLLEYTPSSWQDPEFCKDVVSKITEPVCQNVAKWCQSVLSSYLSNRRGCYDKLTVLAMDTLILANTHFTLPEDQKSEQTICVVEMIKNVFAHAHPDSGMVLEISNNQPLAERFCVPADGVLSICKDLDNVQKCASQYEKHMLNEFDGCLSGFLKTCHVYSACTLLPVVTSWMSYYRQEDTLWKGFVDSVTVLGSMCNNFLSLDRPTESKMVVEKYCNMALQQLAILLTNKELDLTMMKQTMDLYIQLCTGVSSSQHLKSALHAIASRVQVNDQATNNNKATIDRSDSPGSDLGMLSNDIRESPAIHMEPHQDLEESEDSDNELHSTAGLVESQTLNVSGSSSGTRSPRHSVSAQDVPVSPRSDDDSDWDSWSDNDEEDNNAVNAALAEFCTKLKQQCNQGEPTKKKKVPTATLR